jgi:hypothetical protein
MREILNQGPSMVPLTNLRGSQRAGALAGQPKKRAMIAELIKRGRELAEPDDERTDEQLALEYVKDWVASGRTLVALAHDVTRATGVDIIREQISKWVRQVGGEEGEGAVLSHARSVGAHALVEAGLEGILTAPPVREELQRAKLAADQGNYIAERWNREELGARNGAQVSISLTVAHLEALRARPTAVVHLEAPSTDENGVVRVTGGEVAQLVEVIEDSATVGE